MREKCGLEGKLSVLSGNLSGEVLMIAGTIKRQGVLGGCACHV